MAERRRDWTDLWPLGLLLLLGGAFGFGAGDSSGSSGAGAGQIDPTKFGIALRVGESGTGPAYHSDAAAFGVHLNMSPAEIVALYRSRRWEHAPVIIKGSFVTAGQVAALVDVLKANGIGGATRYQDAGEQLIGEFWPGSSGVVWIATANDPQWEARG
jgi:hypothetical protein